MTTRASMLPPLLVACLLACQAREGSSSQPESDLAACDAQTEIPAFERSPGGTPELSVHAVQAAACKLRLVDVRDRDELGGELGSIAGVEQVPLHRIALEATQWRLDEPIVFVCRSGRRSARAAAELQSMGFERVASMTGGMLRWNDAQLPVTHELPPTQHAPPALDAAHRITRDEVAAHLGDRAQVRWTKAATLMLHGSQACVDGRDAHAIIGTPGGDAGELLLTLAVAERLRDAPFRASELENLFDAYLAAFGHFYLHTDAVALSRLLERVGGAPREVARDLDAATAYMRAPPQAVQEELLARLTDPAHVGCGHLRLMLQHPEQYGVRAELVAQVMRIFYRRLWDGREELDFVVLEGGHEESAVVSVELAHEVHGYTRIPLVSPRIAGTEVFVIHPQVSRFVRRENASFLLEQRPELAARVEREAFFSRLEALAATQLSQTVSHLAAELPVYEVTFSDARDTFEVRAVTRP